MAEAINNTAEMGKRMVSPGRKTSFFGSDHGGELALLYSLTAVHAN